MCVAGALHLCTNAHSSTHTAVKLATYVRAPIAEVPSVRRKHDMSREEGKTSDCAP